MLNSKKILGGARVAASLFGGVSSATAADTKDAKGVTVSDTTFGDIDIKATDKDGFFTQAKLDAARGGVIGALPSGKLAKGYTSAPSYAPGDKSYSKVVKK